MLLWIFNIICVFTHLKFTVPWLANTLHALNNSAWVRCTLLQVAASKETATNLPVFMFHQSYRLHNIIKQDAFLTYFGIYWWQYSDFRIGILFRISFIVWSEKVHFTICHYSVKKKLIFCMNLKQRLLVPNLFFNLSWYITRRVWYQKQLKNTFIWI